MTLSLAFGNELRTVQVLSPIRDCHLPALPACCCFLLIGPATFTCDPRPNDRLLAGHSTHALLGRCWCSVSFYSQFTLGLPAVLLLDLPGLLHHQAMSIRRTRLGFIY